MALCFVSTWLSSESTPSSLSFSSTTEEKKPPNKTKHKQLFLTKHCSQPSSHSWPVLMALFFQVCGPNLFPNYAALPFVDAGFLQTHLSLEPCNSLWWGYPEHYSVFSSMCGLYLLDTPSKLGQPKMSPDHCYMSPGGMNSPC